MNKKIYLYTIIFSLYFLLYIYLLFFFINFTNVYLVLIIGFIYTCLYYIFIIYSFFLFIKSNKYIRIYILSLILILLILNSINIDFEKKHGSSIKIFDRNNILIYAKNNNAPIFELKNIPDFLKNTVIFLEDKRFYLHNGYDILSIIRSIYYNTKYGYTLGGSTITQQTVKNLYYKKLPRNYLTKAIEICAAIIFELKYSKDDILKTYLNNISFGSNIIGLEDASIFYFGKSVKNLSNNEIITLLTIPNAPSIYNLRNSQNQLQSKKQYLLNKLYNAKLITYEKYIEILNEKIIIKPIENINKIPHFTFLVLNELKKNNIDIANKHLEIYTTIDLYTNNQINEIMKKHINLLKKFNANNASVVILDNTNASILNYIGSLNYFNDNIQGKVDIINSYRQMGSALKPFIYGLAFTNGLSPKDKINDDKSNFVTKNGMYRPKNYDMKYHGTLTLEEALGNSLNIPAVKILEYIQIDKLIGFFKKANINYISDNKNFYGLSLALGSAEMKLIDVANIYSAVSNKGMFKKYNFITKIIDTTNNKNIYINNKNDKKIQLFDPNITYVITHILSTDTNRRLQFGIDSYLKTTYPTSVKTGTTRGYKDNLIFGYNKYITVGIWVGNTNAEKMRNISGVTGAGPIYWDIMENIYKDKINLIENKKYFDTAKKYYDLFLKNKNYLIDNTSSKNKIYSNKPYIYSPENMSVYKINNLKPYTDQKLLFYVKNNSSDIKWIIYNISLKKKTYINGNNKFIFLNKGKYNITALSNNEIIDNINIIVK